MCRRPKRKDGYVKENHVRRFQSLAHILNLATHQSLFSVLHYKWCVGNKKRCDHIFYESAGYIKPVWVDPVDRNNTAKIEDLMRGEYRRVIENWGR